MPLKEIIEETASLFWELRNTSLTVEQFLEKQKKIDAKMLEDAAEVSEANLEESRSHEQAHSDVCKKYSIGYKYFKIKSREFCVVPSDKDLSRFDKEALIRFFIEFYFEPMKRGEDGIVADMLFYNILKGFVRPKEGVRTRVAQLML